MAEVNPAADDPFFRGAFSKRLQEALLPLVDSASQILSESVPKIPRYDIQNKLGEGGMAVVYRALDRELNRPVALKFLKETLGSHESTRTRFLREATSIAQIVHPNVIVVHDTGEAEGHPYLAMELVDGRPLSEMISQRTHETSLLIRILEKAARGVAAAHQLGIIHRDLKPGNILVGHEDEPKVVDFGLAHLSGGDAEITRVGAVVGTPPYMPPEQVQGRVKDISPRTDVYSLGAILYEILTGRPPFTGDSVTEIYGRILSEDPVLPRAFHTRVSRDIEAVTMKALEKDPLRRYEDAASFADDLRRFIAGEPVQAQRPGLVRGAYRWIRRHRRASAAAAILLTASLTLGAVVSFRWISARDRARDLLRDAREDRDYVVKHEREIARMRVQLKDAEDKLDPWALPVERKILPRLRWEIETKLLQVAERTADLVSNGQEAITIDPSSAEARTFLADWYWSRLLAAEAEGEIRKVIIAQKLVARHDPDGRYTPQLRSGGTLKLATSPSGAEAYLFRYQPVMDGRQVAAPYAPGADTKVFSEFQASRIPPGTLQTSRENLLGVTPFTAPALRQGSYLILLRKPDFRDVLLPLLVTRGTALDLRVPLYADPDIGEGFVYVPAGPFIAGGQVEVRANPRRAHESIPGFFISRFEVTAEEYAKFLNDAKWHSLDEAWKKSPRETRNAPPWLWTRAADRIAIPAGWLPNAPVLGISAHDADDYCRWRTRIAERRGVVRVFRLPTSDEWEKAARGVDGRKFPWGDVFDWSFTRGYYSRQNPLELDAVGTFVADETPYGGRDFGGSATEWTSTTLDKDGVFRLYRGGAWNYGEIAAYQSTYFQPTNATAAHNNLGFRIARDLPPD